MGRAFESWIVEVEGSGSGTWLSEQLGQIGVRAKVVETNLLDYLDSFTGDIDAFVWGWAADVPDPSGILSPFLEHHDGIVFRNVEMEELLERARMVRDQDERLAMYREVERVWISEHVALVPIQYNRRTTLLRPWVDGYWQNALVTSGYGEAVVRR